MDHSKHMYMYIRYIGLDMVLNVKNIRANTYTTAIINAEGVSNLM